MKTTCATKGRPTEGLGTDSFNFFFSYDLITWGGSPNTNHGHYEGGLVMFRGNLTVIAGNDNNKVETLPWFLPGTPEDQWNADIIPPLRRTGFSEASTRGFSSLVLNDTIYVFGMIIIKGLK